MSAPPDPDNPAWHRKPKEPTMWFQRFLMYRDRGPGRTLLAAFNFLKRQEGDYTGDEHGNAPCLPGSWKQNAAKWHWCDRAAAWDDDQYQEREQRYKKQRLEIEDAEFQISMKLFNKANRMADWPLADQEVVDSATGEKTIVTAAGWSQGTIPNMVKAASDLARRARNMSLTGPVQPSSAHLGPTPDELYERDLEDIEWLREAIPVEKKPVAAKSKRATSSNGSNGSNGSAGSNGKH